MAFGDPTPPKSDGSDKSGSAKGILTQIKGLLNQYIDLGDSTPLKGEAESFLDQVEDGLDQLEGVHDSPAEDAAEKREDEVEDAPSKPTTFRDATKAASKNFSKAMAADKTPSDGTKAPDDGEQSKEDPFKKRSKAGY